MTYARIRLDDFISHGCGNRDGDEWVASMLRLCMSIGYDPTGSVPSVMRTDRERAWAVGKLEGAYGEIMRRLFGIRVQDDVWASRLSERSRGTDGDIVMGSMLDFAASADPMLLSRLSRLYYGVTRMTGREAGADGRLRRAAAFRHLVAPVMAQGCDGSRAGTIAACTAGFLPPGLLSPSLDEVGYRGPGCDDDSLLRAVVTMDPDGFLGATGTDDHGAPPSLHGMYAPAATGAMGIPSAAAGGGGAAGRLKAMRNAYAIIDPCGTWPEWVMPAVRPQDLKTGMFANGIAAYSLGPGITAEDLAWAVSGPLDPEETGWLLGDVDWGSPADPAEVMDVLADPADGEDPCAWTRIMWRPLAAAVAGRDAHAAVVAMRAFHVATSPVLPRFIVGVERDGGRQAMHVTLVPRPPWHDATGLSAGFLHEDVMASGMPVAMRLPGVDGAAFSWDRGGPLVRGLCHRLGIAAGNDTMGEAPTSALDRLGADVACSWRI